MACSWSKQPFYLNARALNDVNDAVVGGQITTVPNGVYASQGEQTLPGDHAVLDEAAALALSDTNVGTLHGGYYQYVNLDYAIAGVGAVSQLASVTAAGTGYVQATTTVSFTAAPAGGRTAVGFALVSAAGVVTQVVITDQGLGYTAAPTVTITGAGTGATATVTVQAASPLIPGQALYWKPTGALNGPYVVTNVQAGATPNFAGVLLNPNATPGNYIWIQCLGRATGLVDAASGAVLVGSSISLSAATGTSNASFLVSTSTAAGASSLFVGVAETAIATSVAGNTALIDIQKASLRF